MSQDRNAMQQQFSVEDLYAPVAQSFKADHDFGDKLNTTALLTWARRKGDSFATDLLVCDEKKAAGSVRTHLNAGGKSKQLAPDERFILDQIAGRPGWFVLRSQAERMPSGRASRQMSGILGIDPGLTGALALYRGGQWILLDMPIAGDSKHHEINGAEICRWLREYTPDHAFIEYAAARPGQGVTSMFRFGCAYGALKMALAACGVPYTTITSARWKPAVGVPKGADKEASRRRALQLFPDQAEHLARKRDHGIADAMLIAHFGAKAGAL